MSLFLVFNYMTRIVQARAYAVTQMLFQLIVLPAAAALQLIVLPAVPAAAAEQTTDSIPEHHSDDTVSNFLCGSSTSLVINCGSPICQPAILHIWHVIQKFTGSLTSKSNAKCALTAVARADKL